MSNTNEISRKDLDAALDAIAARMLKSARSKLRTAENYPKDSAERRHLENGAMCYGNCYSMLMEARGIALPHPSPVPSVTQ